MKAGQRISFQDANSNGLTGKVVNGRLVSVAADGFSAQVRRDDSGRTVTVLVKRIVIR
jgi:hypothetical protein